MAFSSVAKQMNKLCPRSLVWRVCVCCAVLDAMPKYGGRTQIDDDTMRALLAKYNASAVTSSSDIHTQQPDESTVTSDQVLEERGRLEGMRRGLSIDERLKRAETFKAQANVQFGAAAWKTAVVGYLAGIWMIKRGEAPCPVLVASHDSGLGEVASSLGDGSALSGEELEAVSRLRVVLHLNLAAAALKLSEWDTARTACEHVLEFESNNSKALFRLAKALEGAQRVEDAISVTARLLKADATNLEGRRLQNELRARQRKESSMFKGLFARARAEGEGLYTAAEERRDEEMAEAALAKEREEAPARALSEAMKAATQQPEGEEWVNPLAHLRGMDLETMQLAVAGSESQARAACD